MSDLLIKGMTLPEEGETIILAIDSEGNIDQQAKYLNCFYHLENVAIEVPPHGDLCDKDKLKEATKNTEIHNSRGEIYPIGKAIAKMIDEAPTVLEAST